MLKMKKKKRRQQLPRSSFRRKVDAAFQFDWAEYYFPIDDTERCRLSPR